MSDVVLRAERLSKMYHIGRREERPDSLREAVVAGFKVPWQRLRRGGAASDRDEDVIWALKDVSFEVERGEVLGVIGRNGAGKSTLLKILSQITEPTRGRAEIHGRVGSLLEVGTGFHQELTGRENVYLSGAVLGMTRSEIEQKFDEIVAYSGVEKFIDTPIKRFSIGMKVRLGFAVAAHLEPEIMLIDEVLAVGDASFQKKCIGKMSSISREGRTILFVSHDMTAIQSLCTRCLLIDRGQVLFDGSSGEAVKRYLQAQAKRGEVTFGPETARTGSGLARLTGATVFDEKGRPMSAIGVGDGFTVKLDFKAVERIADPSFDFLIHDSFGQRLATLSTRITHGTMPDITDDGSVFVHVDRFDALPGLYYLTVGISTFDGEVDLIDNALEIEVTPRDVYGTGKLPPPASAAIYVPCRWQHGY